MNEFILKMLVPMIVRLFMAALGGWLVKAGWDAESVAGLPDQLTALLGVLVWIGTAAWAGYKKPSVAAHDAAKAVDAGLVAIIKDKVDGAAMRVIRKK